MSMHSAVTNLIESKGTPMSAIDAVRAELALDLARRLDGGEVDDRSVPPMVRELRAVVAELSAGSDDGFEQLLASLSAPVRDAKD